MGMCQKTCKVHLVPSAPFYRGSRTKLGFHKRERCAQRAFNSPVARAGYPGHRDGNTELIRFLPSAVARVSSGVSRRVATIIVAGKRALAAAGNNSGPRAVGLANANRAPFSPVPVSRRVQIRSPLPSTEYECAAPYVRSYV